MTADYRWDALMVRDRLHYLEEAADDHEDINHAREALDRIVRALEDHHEYASVPDGPAVCTICGQRAPNSPPRQAQIGRPGRRNPQTS